MRLPCALSFPNSPPSLCELYPFLFFHLALLLQSLDHLKDEYRFEYKYEAWKAMQQDAINLSDPPGPIPPGTKPLPAYANALATRLLSTEQEVGNGADSVANQT